MFFAKRLLVVQIINICCIMCENPRGPRAPAPSADAYELNSYIGNNIGGPILLASLIIVKLKFAYWPLFKRSN